MKSKEIKYLDLGRMAYKQTWERQEELLNQIVQMKKLKIGMNGKKIGKMKAGKRHL